MSGRPSIRFAGPGFIALLIAAAAMPLLVGATAPAPSPGTATIDGNPAEWDLTADLFSIMTNGGSPIRPVFANFYARYDCETNTLAGLVLVKDGQHAQQTRPENAYFRIDEAGKAVSGNSGNDGTPPDFAWVNPDGTFADGFEASIILVPGSYTIRVHILIADDTKDGYTTFDTVPRNAPLVLDCGVPGSPESASPASESPASASPADGSPAGSEEAVSSAPSSSPSGEVAGVQGTPRLTPPPTDSVATGATASAAGWIAAGIALVGVGLLLRVQHRAIRRR